MKVLVLVCLLVAVVNASPFLKDREVKFQAFKLKHGKTYKDKDEEAKRFGIFKDNLRSIEKHNALNEQGLSSYKEGINQFTDMSSEEFRTMLTLSASKKPNFHGNKHVKTGLAIPESVDWRTTGQVTEIKDQGNCGSCWAFSITGSTESAYYRKNGKLVSLSEQQLIDCTGNLNGGCDGGYLGESFPYVVEYGLQSEDSYPYLAVNGTSCKYSPDEVVAKISNYSLVDPWDEDALLDAVANVGPVSVSIDATFLEGYASGIYDDNWCDPYNLNHAVLVVGYGSQDGTDFWIVKNSWGTTFGENGYVRMLRGFDECGIAVEPVYPLIN